MAFATSNSATGRVHMGASSSPTRRIRAGPFRREGRVSDCKRRAPSRHKLLFQSLFVWLVVGCSDWISAQTPAALSITNAPVAKDANAKAAFDLAQTRYRAERTNAEAAWHFGRACFELAEFASTKSQRATLAEQGIAACHQALASASNSAPAHYYLGLNYGQLARTRGLSALRLVGLMRDEWEHARRLDERLDHAGPDLHLGLLYRDTPAFGSIGDRKEARRYLLRAVELAPDFPENRLALIESYLKWGEGENARRELKALEESWPRGRAALTGPAWAARWADWESQRLQFRNALGEPKKPDPHR